MSIIVKVSMNIKCFQWRKVPLISLKRICQSACWLKSYYERTSMTTFLVILRDYGNAKRTYFLHAVFIFLKVKRYLKKIENLSAPESRSEQKFQIKSYFQVLLYFQIFMNTQRFFVRCQTFIYFYRRHPNASLSKVAIKLKTFSTACKHLQS